MPRRRSKKVPHDLAESKFLRTIREGVERFILKDATVEEFLAMVRALSEKENSYSHQLTKGIFSQIVKQAIKKRNQRLKKRESGPNHERSKDA